MKNFNNFTLLAEKALVRGISLGTRSQRKEKIK
jgi:hypothetical protein